MRITKLSSVLLPALLAMPLAGCGGGGVFDPPVEAQMPIVPSRSGIVSSSSVTHMTTLGAWGVLVGDDVANDRLHGYYRFDLSSIPPGANIVSAELEIGQEAVGGTYYATMGDVQVDHVTVGANLDQTDYNGGFQWVIGTLSADDAIEAKSLDVLTKVLDDLNDGRTTADFRLRSNSDNDGSADLTFWNTHDNRDGSGSGNMPRLIVRYDP